MRNPKYNILIVFGTTLFLVPGLLLYANGCGLGLTYDSHLYLTISRDFGENGLIGGLQHQLLQIKPPLYPLLLAIFPGQTTLLLHIGCYIITVTVSCYLASHFIRSFLYKGIYMLFLLFGTPLITVHCFVWTEPPFIALFSILLVVLYHYIDHQRPVALFVVSVLCVLLLSLRHAGIFIVLGLVISLFLFRSTSPARAILILSISVCLFISWAVFKSEGFSKRFLLLIDPVLQLNFERYTHNAAAFANGFSLWVLPNPVPFIYRILVLVILIAWLVYQHSRQGHTNPQRNFWKYVLCTFTVYYIGLHTAFKVEYFSVDAERYLTPFYPVLVLFALSVIESYRKHRTLIIGFLFIFSLYPISRTLKNVHFWHWERCIQRQAHGLPNHQPVQGLSLYEIFVEIPEGED